MSQRGLWPAVVGLAFLGAALAFASLLRARQELTCDLHGAERRCVIVEHSLLGERSRATIVGSELERVEVANLRDADDDEDTWCVLLVTSSASHKVDRCSALEEPRLDALAQELRAFYAGEGLPIARTLVDDGFVLFIVLLPGVMGLLAMLGPTVWRTELDRQQGVAVIRGGFWFRPRTVRLALDLVVGVSIVTWLSEDGERNRLVLDLADGRKIELSEDTAADLEPARQKVEAFLRSSRPAYR